MNRVFNFIKGYPHVVKAWAGTVFLEIRTFINSRAFAILSVLPFILMILIPFGFAHDRSAHAVMDGPLSYFGRLYPVWFIFWVASMIFFGFANIRFYAMRVGLSRAKITFLLSFVYISMGMAITYAFGTLFFHLRHVEDGLSPPPELFAGMQRIPGEVGVLWVLILAAAMLLSFLLASKYHWPAIVFFVAQVAVIGGGGWHYMAGARALDGQMIIALPLFVILYIPAFLKYKKPDTTKNQNYGKGVLRELSAFRLTLDKAKKVLTDRLLAILSLVPVIIAVVYAFFIDTSTFPYSIWQVSLSFIGYRNPIWFLMLCLAISVFMLVTIRHFTVLAGLDKMQKRFVYFVVCIGIGLILGYGVGVWWYNLSHIRWHRYNEFTHSLLDFFRYMRVMPDFTRYLWAAIFGLAIMLVYAFAIKKSRVWLVTFAVFVAALTACIIIYALNPDTLTSQLIFAIPLFVAMYAPSFFKRKQIGNEVLGFRKH